MENEIIVQEEMNQEPIVADEGASLGTGAAMLIGAGLAFAVSGVVKLGRKAVAKFKERKALKQPTEEVTQDDLVEADVIPE